MITTDPIADMLTRIRNAVATNKTEVLVPYSKIKESIAGILQQAGYIATIKVVEQGNGKNLALTLEGSNKAETIQRISKPGRRIYVKKHEIPTVRSGLGMVIVSTPSGIMSGSDAKAKGLGGELICKVW